MAMWRSLGEVGLLEEMHPWGQASRFQSFHPFMVHFLFVIRDVSSPQLFASPWLPVAMLPCHDGNGLLSPCICKAQINSSLPCIALVMVFYLSNRKATKTICMNTSFWKPSLCTMTVRQQPFIYPYIHTRTHIHTNTVFTHTNITRVSLLSKDKLILRKGQKHTWEQACCVRRHSTPWWLTGNWRPKQGNGDRDRDISKFTMYLPCVSHRVGSGLAKP